MSLALKKEFAADLIEKKALSLIAIKPRDKVAWGTWAEFQNRKQSVEELFKHVPSDINIAIVTGRISGLVVVDLDTPDAQAWAANNLPSTPMKTQTADGQHWYYAYPPTAMSIRNKAKFRLGDVKLSLDIRADGGYVMAPLSIHPSGVVYRMIGSWKDIDIKSLPVFSSTWFEKRENLEVVEFLKHHAPAVEGDGGDQLTFILCCRLTRNFGLRSNEALNLLLEHWNPRCQPPWSIEELEQKIQNAIDYGDGPILPRADEVPWQSLIPLGDNDLPTFPRGVFPELLEKYLVQLSDCAETPFDLAALLFLGAVSTAALGKYSIHVTATFSEPCPLWILVVLEPGNRKSFIFSTLMNPIIQNEIKLQEKAKDQIRKTEASIKFIESKVTELRKKITTGKGDQNKIIEEIDQLEASKPERLFLPRLVVNDITPEKLAVIMAENQEVISLLSDEGGFFENIGGRYNKGVPNFDLFLQSYSRSPVRVDRKNDLVPVKMNSPCLTLGATVQPAVLARLSDRPEFRTIGLLSRFIYTVPASPLGFRNGDEREVDSELSNEYQKMIEKLLAFDPFGEWKMTNV